MHGHTALHSHTCVDNCKNVAVPKLPPPLLRSYGRGGQQSVTVLHFFSSSSWLLLWPTAFALPLKKIFPHPLSSQVRVRGCPCSSFHQKERDSQPSDQTLLWGHKIAAHKAPSFHPSFHSGTHVCTLCGARVRFRVHSV